MWTRITTSDQLKSIGVGTLLLKYPTLGSAVNSLDINDRERISVRYVTKNFPTQQEFDISLIPYQLEHFVYMLSGLSNLTFAAMHKKYMDIITEGNYWVYKG
jgi:hypothetical protein